jgi:opacity protein-like surface antigen
MQKRLIVLVLCVVLVSAVSVTSVVSTRHVSNSNRLGGAFFIIEALYKFWQSKLNPTLTSLINHILGGDNLGLL